MSRFLMSLVAYSFLSGCQFVTPHEKSPAREAEECDGGTLELFREPELSVCWARDGNGAASVGFQLSCDVFEKCQSLHSQTAGK